MTDLYSVLDVPRDASLPEIKAAYRRLAKLSHPDVAGAEKNGEFLLLCRAWEVLSDADARKHYDETGELPGETSERSALLGIMADIFRQVTDQALQGGVPLRQVNFIALMREHARTKRRDLDRAVSNSRRAIDELTDLRGRITREGEGENLFASHLTQRIGELQASIKQMQGALRLSDLMEAELESYANEVELIRAMQVSTYSKATSSRVYQVSMW
ncbi:J domain-containing protein [Rhizobium leguminosarum]|uniref:J domain-containing protein n=1 Tax=Rhizobium leguminosarum TaxID=384 RepID=UPI001C9063E5|nr:J domain-containing protein [Rhizobium leguminosarum]MBY2911374.1 J domain-containing protein [Rhizobium leguminosarum]